MIDRQAVTTRSTDFRALVEENKKQVYYLALRLTGNHHDAEDLSQEVFIKALKGMKDFRGESAVDTWLHRITVNTFLNRRRRKGFGGLFLLGTRDEAPIATDPRPRPDDQTEASLLHRNIDRALDQLAPRERSAFVLRHYQDLTVPEIARALSVAEGTVKSLLFRATRKMRGALKPYRDHLDETDTR